MPFSQYRPMQEKSPKSGARHGLTSGNRVTGVGMVTQTVLREFPATAPRGNLNLLLLRSFPLFARIVHLAPQMPEDLCPRESVICQSAPFEAPASTPSDARVGATSGQLPQPVNRSQQ